MITRRTILGTGAAMIATGTMAKTTTRTEVSALRFSKSTEPDLRLRLLIPNSDVPTPFVVFAHGKGTAYDSTSFDTVFNAILGRGIAVASIQYQQAPDAIIPVPMQQAWGAIRFLRGEASNYNLQQSMTGVMGSSAGSALMAQVANESDAGWTGSFGLHPNKSCKVHAQVLVSACVFDPNLANFSADAQAYIAAQYNCAALTSCSPTGVYLPQYHFDSTKPDALVIAGDADTDVPIAHSQNTVAAMIAAGMSASLITNAGIGHGWTNANLQATAIADFFQAKLL